MGSPIPPPQIGPGVLESPPGGFLYYIAFSEISQELFSDYAGDQCCFSFVCKTDLVSGPPQSLISIVQVDCEVKN